MEKLKQAKHNHLLTDWLKVGIFALLLLLPFFVFAPTAFYYGFNEHATAPTKQVENTTTINMQQQVVNGLPSSTNYMYSAEGNVFGYEDDAIYLLGDSYYANITFKTNLIGNSSEYILCSLTYVIENAPSDISVYLVNEDQSFEVVFVEDNTLISDNHMHKIEFINQVSSTSNNISYVDLLLNVTSENEDFVIYFQYVELFNLTQMFGTGNEPTVDEFNALFPNDYYENNSDANVELPNGTYTTYTDISSTMSFAWESMFDTPLLKWTKNSPFKTSINGFLTLFQIPQQSGIGLYLNYLITMVCIYVVFDIVIQLFKWITHIIGEK